MKILDLHNKIIGNLELLVGDETDCEETKPVYVSRRYFNRLKKSGMMKTRCKMLSLNGKLAYKDISPAAKSPVYRTINFVRVRDSARALLKILRKIASESYLLPSSFDCFYSRYVGFRFAKTSIRYMPLQGTFPWETKTDVLLINVSNISVTIEYEQSTHRYYAVDIVLHPFYFTAISVLESLPIHTLLSNERVLTA